MMYPIIARLLSCKIQYGGQHGDSSSSLEREVDSITVACGSEKISRKGQRKTRGFSRLLVVHAYCKIFKASGRSFTFLTTCLCDVQMRSKLK